MGVWGGEGPVNSQSLVRVELAPTFKRHPLFPHLASHVFISDHPMCSYGLEARGYAIFPHLFPSAWSPPLMILAQMILYCFFKEELMLSRHSSAGGWGRTRNQPPQLWFLKSRIWKQVPDRIWHSPCSGPLSLLFLPAGVLPWSPSQGQDYYALSPCSMVGLMLNSFPMLSFNSDARAGIVAILQVWKQRDQRTCPASHARLWASHHPSFPEGPLPSGALSPDGAPSGC